MDGPPLDSRVEEHYRDEIDEDARIRDGGASLELLRVQEIVRCHLPPGPLRILDVGGATGVHAEWLLEDGHSVRLVEPVASQVEHARRRLGENPNFLAEVGDARSLSVDPGEYDAVLLFGPLYHLWERNERMLVWLEAKRAARPSGGLIFAMGISRYASLLDGLAHGYLFDPAFRTIVDQDLATGRHENPDKRPGWFTNAYFHAPGELAIEAEMAGLEVRQVAGVEGMAAWLPSLDDHWDDPPRRQVLVDAARRTQDEPGLAALSPHHVVVAAVA